MAKKLIKEIRPYVKLYRDTNNGIAWIEDGSTGLGISVHPNLDKSGSVTGMKKLGYWDKSDRIVLSHGWKYNIDRFVCDKKNDLEMIVADECMCRACLKIKWKNIVCKKPERLYKNYGTHTRSNKKNHGNTEWSGIPGHFVCPRFLHSKNIRSI